MEPKLTKEEKKQLRKQERAEWEKQLDAQRRTSLFKKIALWGGIALFLAISIWGIYAASTQPSSSATPDITMPPVTDKDFQTPTALPNEQVNPNLKTVTLVEYSDFQCPACKAYYPLVMQLQKDYGAKLHFVYRFFPLENVHKNAEAASRAGFAASLQGKFWEMHDVLFEKQDSWAQLPDPTDAFVGYAKDMGLSIEGFKKDYTSDKAKKFVENSYQNALNLGLQGTPSFFLNGKLITSPQGYQPFKTLIDNALKSK